MAADEPHGVCRAHQRCATVPAPFHERLRMTSETRMGFVGIGAMGSRMAANLARAGYPLMVRDADQTKAQDFTRSHQARVAVSLAELGRNADMVICMLPTGPIVRSVFLQEEDG